MDQSVKTSIKFDHLEEAEQDGDNTKDASGTSDLESAGGTLGITAGAAAAAAAGAAAIAVAVALRDVAVLGVGLLATASVGALDGTVAAELLELLASVVNVLGRAKGEGTTNVGKLGEGSTSVTVSIDSKKRRQWTETYVSMASPYMSTAPATVSSSGKPLTSESSVLFWIDRPPVTVWSWGKEMLVAFSQLTMERVPPTSVRLGA